MVALRGYVFTDWKTRLRASHAGRQYPSEIREFRGRDPYQGGKQVVQDLTQIIDFSRTLLARKASRVLRFPAIIPFRTAARSHHNQNHPNRKLPLNHNVGDKNPAVGGN